MNRCQSCGPPCTSNGTSVPVGGGLTVVEDADLPGAYAFVPAGQVLEREVPERQPLSVGVSPLVAVRKRAEKHCKGVGPDPRAASSGRARSRQRPLRHA